MRRAFRIVLYTASLGRNGNAGVCHEILVVVVVSFSLGDSESRIEEEKCQFKSNESKIPEPNRIDNSTHWIRNGR